MYSGNVKKIIINWNSENFFQKKVFKKMQGFCYLCIRRFSLYLLTFIIKSDYLKTQTRVVIYFLIIKKNLLPLHDGLFFITMRKFCI